MGILPCAAGLTCCDCSHRSDRCGRDSAVRMKGNEKENAGEGARATQCFSLCMGPGGDARRSILQLLLFFAELLDVVRDFADGYRFFPLHHLPHFFHYVRISEGRDVPGSAPVRDSSEDTAHELARARLRHIGNDMDVLWPSDLANDGFDRLIHLIDNLLARLHSRLESDVDLGHAFLDLVDNGHNRGFTYLRYSQAR